MNGIQTIDCLYLRPQFAASYLMAEGDEALFIENNTARSVSILLSSLKNKGISPEQVRYVIITHVHLDHAGGSHALMRACPNAQLLAHPKAAAHMIDPSKLVASARKVYGDRVFEELYGEIGPIEPSRVRAMRDGEVLPFGSRQLRFFFTRGHANHHFCVHDDRSRGVFTGDSFGLAYPALQRNGLFIFPSTSPTDFDPAEARISIRKILETAAERAFLTHFGEIDDLPEAARQLQGQLDFSEKLLEECARSAESDAQLDRFCETRLKEHFESILEKNGLSSLPGVWEWLELDLRLNAAGIAHLARRRRMRPQ